MPLEIQRVYQRNREKDAATKSFRVFVDRLWARGIKKEEAGIDLWLKDIAPSDKLRKWFGHEPQKWGEFKKRYFEELDNKQELVEQLLQKVRAGETICLLYGAKDEKFNNAAALREYLLKRL
jgi:uncharacterized protein YeaO (DUF488 family)